MHVIAGRDRSGGQTAVRAMPATDQSQGSGPSAWTVGQADLFRVGCIKAYS